MKRITRRGFLGILGGGALGVYAAGTSRRRFTAIENGLKYLVAAQAADGSWCSAHYGFFRDGDALTPLILWVLQRASSDDRLSRAAAARGARWLDRLTDELAETKELWHHLRYPLFAASYAGRYYAIHGDLARASVWADCIVALQLSEALGWGADDPRCGAWSDSPSPPRRAASLAIPDMLNPNISATAMAVLALSAVDRRDAAARAQSFARRAQNWPDRLQPDARFDDGGFFFALGDPARNKAGVAGCDSSGNQRYRSYGSATCDGLLILRALSGHALNGARARAALQWLRAEAMGDRHPGNWPADREDSGRALYFYYVHALAQLLERYPNTISSAATDRIRNSMIARQSADGSWSNPDPESCEDDPLVSTAFALTALTKSPQSPSPIA